MKTVFMISFFVIILPIFSMEISYQLMNEQAFQQNIVGNTVVGITRQSHSLYMLHFLADGQCKLWKQGKVYSGKWWIEGECVRAFWPDYHSLEPQSLFSLENPQYGTATALRYYYNFENGGLFLAGKNFQVPALTFTWMSFQKFLQ